MAQANEEVVRLREVVDIYKEMLGIYEDYVRMVTDAGIKMLPEDKRVLNRLKKKLAKKEGG